MLVVIIMNSVRVSPRLVLVSRNVVKFRLIELSQCTVLGRRTHNRCNGSYPAMEYLSYSTLLS